MKFSLPLLMSLFLTTAALAQETAPVIYPNDTVKLGNLKIIKIIIKFVLAQMNKFYLAEMNNLYFKSYNCFLYESTLSYCFRY